jgi:hypothetical protein
MTNKKPLYPKFNFDEYARTCAPDDFLGQTRRTVNGKPVSDEQLQMIVKAIGSGLRMSNDDVLLDLACGNGALSRFLFSSCAEYLGVDLSEYLISVAKKNFEIPSYRFIEKNVTEYVQEEKQPERFTKVLCYGSFQYFPATDATEILQLLFEKFSNVQTAFIGNLPDKDRVAEFYKENQPIPEELLGSDSQLGIWRTRDEFADLAGSAGWKVKFSTMPEGFHASYYRYDALLSR